MNLPELYGIAKESIHVIPNGVDINAFFKFEPQTVELIEQLEASWKPTRCFCYLSV